MWKCTKCQNENKDEYRYCLSCGEPRPADGKNESDAEDDAPEKGTKALSTALLVLIALLLVAAIAFVILFFPRMNGGEETQTEETAETDGSRRSHRGESLTEPTEEPARGGTSTYVIGGSASGQKESGAKSTPAPLPTQAPAEATAPAVTPAPEPTAAPVSDGEYLLPDSNSRYLTEADLKGLTWEQCCLARNEIFARHGRIFVTPQISAYFSSKSWYQGTVSAASFSESVFNAYEKANIDFIYNYETSHWGGSYY